MARVVSWRFAAVFMCFCSGFYAARSAIAQAGCSVAGCTNQCNMSSCWDVNGTGSDCRGTSDSQTVTCCTFSYTKVGSGMTCNTQQTNLPSWTYSVCNPGPCPGCDCPTTQCQTQGMQQS